MRNHFHCVIRFFQYLTNRLKCDSWMKWKISRKIENELVNWWIQNEHWWCRLLFFYFHQLCANKKRDMSYKLCMISILKIDEYTRTDGRVQFFAIEFIGNCVCQTIESSYKCDGWKTFFDRSMLFRNASFNTKKFSKYRPMLKMSTITLPTQKTNKHKDTAMNKWIK